MTRKNFTLKARLILLALLLTGCGSQSTFNPINPPTVKASGPQPFPTIPADGGTITLEPGVYACPASIPTSTHIIGRGSIIGNEPYSDPNFAGALQKTGSIKTVRILCSQPLIIKGVADIQISGVIFDFQGNNAGVVLDSVSHSDFSFGIYHTGSALALDMRAGRGNQFANHFGRMMLYDVGAGLLMHGESDDPGVFAYVNTANVFDLLEIMDVHDYGVSIRKFSDTNYFHNVQILALDSSGTGVVFNDQNLSYAPGAGIGADGNVFQEIYINEVDQSNPVACGVKFRGTTLGNFVFVDFAILPDAHKVCIEPGFHTDEIRKLNEWPKFLGGPTQ